MKRTRDDNYAGTVSQFKRPCGPSRGDSNAQYQVPGGGVGGNNGGGGAATSQRLTTNDALSYLKEVKDMFHDQRDKYDMFLEVMKDFKAQRTDTTGVIARVKELFKGHNHLIIGFNTFLPKGYEITLDEDEAPTPPKKTVEFEEAITFVNKIKRRFQNDEHVYKSFLDILNMYRKEHKVISEVYSEVASLFEGHPDLLDEFTRFLPDTSATPSTQHALYGRNPLHFNERTSATPMIRQMQMDKQRCRQDRLMTTHDHDLSVECPGLEDDKAMMNSKKEQRKHSEEGRDRRVHDYNRDLNLQQSPDKKKSVKKTEGFGLTAELTHEDKDAVKNMYSQAFSFCEKVKEKLCSSDDYQAFLKCLHIFSSGIIKRNDLQNLVKDLLGKYPDLMEEFNDFLERCENIDGFLAGVISKKSLCSDGHLSKSSELEEKDKDQRWEYDGAIEKERYQEREKYLGKSIQELDLSNCQQCTPSYRLLPEDYPIPVASQRSELGAQVLNDHWVSVTSGSEDYSFKHMRRNQYEESLFRCEDDRFELDMLLESVSSAAKRAEELYNNINENKINMEVPIRIEEYFSVLNLRCIERLYSDHGLDVIDILCKNPTLALPVILTRLKQKQDEWSRCRSDFNKVWAEIYAKNHYKSLDHRSFYFKQQDSKNLSTKTLVAEIKEIKEKQQKEDDILEAIAFGNKQPLFPHLEFEYADVGIHEDLYELIRYSCEEVFSSKELLNKIMRLWTTFLEPMLGIPSRSHGTKNLEDKKPGHPLPNFVSSNAVNGNGNPHGNSRPPKSDSNEVDERVNVLRNVQQASLSSIDKNNGSVNVDHSCRDDLQMGKCQTSVDYGNKVTGINKQFASDEQGVNCNASISAKGENGQTESTLETTSGCVLTPSQLNAALGDNDSLAKSQDGKLPLMEGYEVASVILLANGGHTKSSNKVIFHEESAGLCKIEKEEGELSPNGHSEENNFISYDEADVQTAPTSKHNIGSRKYRPGNGEEECCQEAGGDNEADADDEDSDNVSEAGEDVSGSETAGDECSREEHDDDEDVEREDVDGKAESEGEAGGMCDVQSAGRDFLSLPLSERFLLTVKPLTKRVSTVPHVERKNSCIFYGNDDFYALFRLHQILYERILSAKTNSVSGELKWKIAKTATSPNPYLRFMNVLYNLLDGTVDNAKFEDECRAIIGNQSYVLFTLDKLIYKLVRQLQTVATDEIDYKLLQLHEYEKSRKHGKLTDSVYHANARVIIHDENIYRFECTYAPTRMSIQLMGNMIEKPELFAISMDPNFASYLYNDYLSVFPGKKELHRIILQRNKRLIGASDEFAAICTAMEGVQVVNGLECKIACNSSKISYVLDTEDFFFRPKRKRKTASGTNSSLNQKARRERYYRLLSVS